MVSCPRDRHVGLFPWTTNFLEPRARSRSQPQISRGPEREKLVVSLFQYKSHTDCRGSLLDSRFSLCSVGVCLTVCLSVRRLVRACENERKRLRKRPA